MHCVVQTFPSTRPLHLFVCLFVRSSIRPSVCPPVRPSARLPVRPFVRAFVRLCWGAKWRGRMCITLIWRSAGGIANMENRSEEYLDGWTDGRTNV